MNNIAQTLFKNSRKFVLPILVGLSSFANAQVSYTGTAYSQSFDSLASTGTTALAFVDNSTIPGWYVENYDTGLNGATDLTPAQLFTTVRQLQSDNYTVGNGGSNSGALYSFGVAGVNPITDRALGTIGSGAPDDFFLGVAVKNDSGSPLAGFTITYDGEQWRRGGSATERAETMQVFYRIGGAAFDGADSWTPITDLNFTSPNITPNGTAAALDGNATGNRVAGITATISAPVQVGQTVWILWADLDHPVNDHGMAIDNFVFNGVSATAGAPVISSSTTASATANSPFIYSIAASASPTSYSAAGLPAWLTLNSSTGNLSGTPPVPGTFPITVSATNELGTGSAVVTITVAPDPAAPVITPLQAITHVINTPLSYQVLASNSPTSYTIGTLPVGLVFDTVTGVISGTPTATANFNNISVSATNSAGTGSGTLNIALVSAPAYTGDLVFSAYAGATGYSLTLPFTQSPYAASIGGLGATGLTDNTILVISGTVTSTPGTYPLVVSADNDYGKTTVNLSFIVVDPAFQATIPQSVVVNKFSNSEPDRVELLVTGGGVPASTVDMRGMVLKDFSGSTVNDGGGRYTFTTNALWSSVKAGTLIVLSNGTTSAEDTDPTDYVLAVNLGNTAYFSQVGTFDIATTEMVMIKAAGTGTGGVAGGIHALSSGSTAAAQYAAFTGPKIGTTTTTPFPSAIIVNNATSTLADFNGTGATGGVALTGVNAVTFGAANNAANQAFITYLKGTPTTTALENWRQTNFGTIANSGDTADSADFDKDGISNLVEYATGTNPTVASANPITVGTKNNAGQFLTLSFNRINDPALTYTILASNDLTGGFTSTGTTYTGSAAGIVVYEDTVSLATPGVRRFLRLQVSYGTP